MTNDVSIEDTCKLYAYLAKIVQDLHNILLRFVMNIAEKLQLLPT